VLILPPLLLSSTAPLPCCRYFIVFQSAEDNLVFRTACADLAAKSLDLDRCALRGRSCARLVPDLGT
jgi:hypothetical protein